MKMVPDDRQLIIHTDMNMNEALYEFKSQPGFLSIVSVFKNDPFLA